VKRKGRKEEGAVLQRLMKSAIVAAKFIERAARAPAKGFYIIFIEPSV